MPNEKTYLKLMKNIPEGKAWFNFNPDGDVPEILIYNFIGDMSDDSISAGQFRQALQACEAKSKKMNLRINSPGGLIHDSFAVYNMIKQSPLEVTAYIDGLAASCASWVPLACNKVFISPQSEMMIHDPYTMMMGGSDDLRKEATHLDSLKNTIVNIYAEKTGMEKPEIEKMMKEGTWMSGMEAVNNGFADDLSEQSMAAACVFDLSMLSNIPKGFLKYQNALKKRALERTPRDVDTSRAEAARCTSKAVINIEEIQNKANELINKEFSKWLM